MKKKKQELFTVEREFLGKVSVQELIARIIKSHLETSVKKK